MVQRLPINGNKIKPKISCRWHTTMGWKGENNMIYCFFNSKCENSYGYKLLIFVFKALIKVSDKMQK